MHARHYPHEADAAAAPEDVIPITPPARGRETQPPAANSRSRGTAVRHVAIAWHGLPFHAARALEELIAREPEMKFTLLTTAAEDFSRHPRFRDIAGVPVRTLERRRRYTWAELETPVPDVFIFTSWRHRAYLSLAKDAKRHPGVRTVSMLDNIFLSRPRRWASLLWYRAVLRRNIDGMWVPGVRARAFARMLGVPEDAIIKGLYGADPCIFTPENREPAATRARQGVLYVGQLTESRGVSALLAAAQRSPRFRATLTIVGEGPREADVRRAGIGRHAFLPPGRLAPLFAQHSLFLLPSRAPHWGVALHEAALSECLLAATPECGAADDLIVPGLNGVLMRGATADAVLDAAEWAETLPPHEERAGRVLSRERAAAFGPDTFCASFARLVHASPQP